MSKNVITNQFGLMGSYYYILQDFERCDPITFTAKCHNRTGGILESCGMASCHFTGLDSPTSVVYLHRKCLQVFLS